MPVYNTKAPAATDKRRSELAMFRLSLASLSRSLTSSNISLVLVSISFNLVIITFTSCKYKQLACHLVFGESTLYPLIALVDMLNYTYFVRRTQRHDAPLMEILGYILAVFIGISLGLIGGGGSILTVPVFVYLFHIEPTLATSYSLFIVGMTSLTGAVYQYSKGYVDMKAALSFGLMSVVTVFIVRKYVLPAIP